MPTDSKNLPRGSIAKPRGGFWVGKRPIWVVCHERRLKTTVRNCTRDEGGAFEAGSQVLASNHCKRRSPKGMVVRVEVNVGTRSGRVGLREASASEPSMKCRKRIRRCQNRGVTLPPGSARGNPEACPSGIRHVGGAKLNQALVRNDRGRGAWSAFRASSPGGRSGSYTCRRRAGVSTQSTGTPMRFAPGATIKPGTAGILTVSAATAVTCEIDGTRLGGGAVPLPTHWSRRTK